MTIVGISFSTLVELFFWGWASGIVTVFAVVAIATYMSKKKKKD